MQNLKTMIDNYLLFCESQKRLDAKTQKAYRIDLEQFSDFIKVDSLSLITPAILEDYITTLHKSYKPKTVKRKIASVKAFFIFLNTKIYF